MAKYVVIVDTETTGLDPNKGAIITQIGCAVVDLEKEKIVDSLDLKLQFKEEKADPEALKHSAYDSEVWSKEAIPFKEAATKLVDFFKKYSSPDLYLGGHNYNNFDRRFLNKFLTIAKTDNPVKYGIDTYVLAMNCAARGLIKTKSLKLSDLVKEFKIKGTQKHDAFDDAMLNAKVYIKLNRLMKNF